METSRDIQCAPATALLIGLAIVLALALAIALALLALAVLPATAYAADASTEALQLAVSLTASGTSETSATVDTSRTPAMPSAHTVWRIGTSVQGRPIVAETFGTGPRRILILGGVHGDEYGIPVAEAFLRYVRSHPAAVPAGVELDIVTCANPDGRALKRRTNSHNVDLNRNFPASNWNRKLGVHGASPGAWAGSEAETRALMALLEQQRYARVISLHSRGGIVDYDGPGARQLARRIGRAAHAPLVRLGAYHGSMGSYVPQRYKIPIVTWELSRRSINARIRAGLLAALR